MSDAADPAESPNMENPEEALRGHLIFVVEKRKLTILLAIVALAAVAIVAGICGSGKCSSSSPSAEDPLTGAPPSPTIPSPQNPTAPVATPAATNPTNAPDVVNPSLPAPTTPPFTSAATPAPIQNAGPVSMSAPTGPPVVSPVSVTSKTLEAVYMSGFLRCGYYDVTVAPDINGNILGFSIDLCTALAAAIFGHTNVTSRVKAIPVTTSNRFLQLNNSEIDVLLGFTTQTMERQILEPTTGMPFAFSTPYLYSTLTFAGSQQYIDCLVQYIDNNETNSESAVCDNVRICIEKASSFAPYVSDLLNDPFSVRTTVDMDDFYTRYGTGTSDSVCTVIAGDQFQVSKYATELYLVDTPDNFTTTVDSLFLKIEPISIITRKDDISWSDFVNWIVYGLLYSEKMGYNRTETLAEPGKFYYMEWDGFGIEYKDMFLNSNLAVGHIGEMYQANLEQFVPRQTINTISSEQKDGVIHSVPLGNLTGSVALDSDESSTLNMIQRNGSLYCGIYVAAIFAVKTSSGFSGFDVDYCRALSAAIFNGDQYRVNYTELSTVERFDALENGTVDVLSRITTITPNRDLLRTFSQPNFFDPFLFGGWPQYIEGCIAPYLKEGDCTDLMICVAENTTYFDVIKQDYQEALVPVNRSTGEEFVQAFLDGRCNVLVSGLSDIALANDLVGNDTQFTFRSPFTVGKEIVDPLALVTRQDDAKWSDFVYLVVTAIFYAEENGISMANAHLMPNVTLFGIRYTQMLQHAIAAVGSYKDIFENNIPESFPRSDRNRAYSKNFSTPLLYAVYDLKDIK